MTTPREIIREVGVDSVAAALGVHEGRVRQAMTEDALPAAWFVQMRALCAGKGVDLPEGVFRWKSAIAVDSTAPASTQHETAVNPP